MSAAPNKAAPSWRLDKRSSTERGYDSRWRKARNHFLSLHQLCEMCKADGRANAAQVVDHRVPHRGDQTLFWDESNWQALCKQHHDGDKQAIDNGNERRTRFDQTGKVIW